MNPGAACRHRPEGRRMMTRTPCQYYGTRPGEIECMVAVVKVDLHCACSDGKMFYPHNCYRFQRARAEAAEQDVEARRERNLLLEKHVADGWAGLRDRVIAAEARLERVRILCQPIAKMDIDENLLDEVADVRAAQLAFRILAILDEGRV